MYMSISDKGIEIKKIVSLVCEIIPMIIQIVKEVIVTIKELQTV